MDRTLEDSGRFPFPIVLPSLAEAARRECPEARWQLLFEISSADYTKFPGVTLTTVYLLEPARLRITVDIYFSK